MKPIKPSRPKIVLTGAQFSNLAEHARKEWPRESCALLLGMASNSIYQVTRVLLAENRDASQVSFSIDPRFLLEAYEEADRMGEELIGIFHSHPAPPVPSGTDLNYMKLNPVVWVIMSMPEGKTRGYILGDGPQEVAVEEIGLETA